MEVEDFRKTIKTFFILISGHPGLMNMNYEWLQCRINSRLDSKWTLVQIKRIILNNIKILCFS